MKFIIPSTRHEMYKPQLLKSATRGVAATRVALLLLVALSATTYAQSVVVLNFTALVDVAVVVSNFTAIVDVAKPDFVMDVDGCSVYVYVVRDFETAKTPLLHTDVPEVRMPASPMESEEILDAFIKALGPRLTAYVTIIKPRGGSERRAVEVSVHNSTELRRAIERALGVIKTQRPVAYPNSLAIEMEDAHVHLFFLGDGNGSEFFQVRKLVIEATRWEKAFEILSRISEAAGGRTPPAYIYIVPYWTDDEESRKLVRAAETLERELGTVRVFPNGVEGIIHVLHYGHVGPYMLVFPYPNRSAPPDRATAEKVVRRFIELAGVCRSPMVAEFWPKTGYEWAAGRRDYTPLILAVAAGIAAVATAAVFILKKRHTN
jgi:hypothetical protein